jgi:hypothetical protein
VSTTEHDPALDLDSRYGRTRSNSRRTKWIVGGTGAAFVAVFAVWLVWGGLLTPPASLDVTDVGHVIVDDSLVQVRYELNVAPGTATRCAVQALNSTFAIVGWNIVDIPASDTRTRTLETDVRTTELGVTGLIYRCWLA